MILNGENLRTDVIVHPSCRTICADNQMAPMNASYEAGIAIRACIEQVNECFPEGVTGHADVVVRYECYGPTTDGFGNWFCQRKHSVILEPLDEGATETLVLIEPPRRD